MQAVSVFNRKPFLCLLLVQLGCGATDQSNARNSQSSGCPPNNPSCMQLPPAPSPGAMAGQQSIGQAGAPATPTAGSPSTSPPIGTGANGVPCNVANVVSNNCTLCHATQPKFGAPMALMTLADFHAPARSNPQRKVFELVSERINTSEVSKLMPPASSDPLAAPDLSAMNAWLTAGAAGVATGACAITADPGTTGMGGGDAPQPPAPGTGISLDPIAYDDPMMECYELRAHSQSSKTQPYSVPTSPDHYVNFHFMPEFDAMRYVRSYRLLLDNEAVVHHWLFFRNAGPKGDGAIENSSGTHPDGQLQHGWAPGGGDVYFQPDVGTEMPHDTSYTLELHYNNTTGGSSPDATGLEVCVTPTRPQNVAILSWLGTDAIFNVTAQGTCDPTSNEPIHIIAGTPHMHTKGTHMKVVLNRAGGGEEVIHDAAFDFNYQVVYPEDVMVMPGDTITTSCTYGQPATFGPGTDSEMCYWFAMHYPANALTNGNPLWSTLHGTNTCLE